MNVNQVFELAINTNTSPQGRRNHGDRDVDRRLARPCEPEQTDRQHDSIHTAKQPAGLRSSMPPARQVVAKPYISCSESTDQLRDVPVIPTHGADVARGCRWWCGYCDGAWAASAFGGWFLRGYDGKPVFHGLGELFVP
jgi:hypothetical protein